MSFLRIDGVAKRYGEAAVIRGVSLTAAEGEFVVFVGPSGCGKSTLLRLVAGLDEVSAGTISIAGTDVTGVPPADRGVAMVFQSYALYPHMSVRENMAFGLKMVKTPAAEIERRVREAAAILRIENLLDRKPRQLSGGQRQRVAIGRAIVRKPRLFLFDEPLSNLDAELRGEMRFEIAKLHRELGVTMVYVTHDQVEAMTLADRIVVLRAGAVEQIGTPADLYERPANTFVAGFIGAPKMNFLAATAGGVDGGLLGLRHPGFEGGVARVPLAGRQAPAPGEEVTVGLRPEDLALQGEGEGEGEGTDGVSLAVRVGLVENLGGAALLHAQTAGDQPIVAQTGGRSTVREGAALRLAVPPERVYLFGRDGAAL
jgi:ABC-type sugar transport system ATPase subunit